jgi:hypothetical protein
MKVSSFQEAVTEWEYLGHSCLFRSVVAQARFALDFRDSSKWYFLLLSDNGNRPPALRHTLSKSDADAQAAIACSSAHFDLGIESRGDRLDDRQP